MPRELASSSFRDMDIESPAEGKDQKDSGDDKGSSHDEVVVGAPGHASHKPVGDGWKFLLRIPTYFIRETSASKTAEITIPARTIMTMLLFPFLLLME